MARTNAADYEYPDVPVDGKPRGRGAGANPGNRFEAVHLAVLGEHLDRMTAEPEGEGGAIGPDGRQVPTVVYRDRTRRIINRIDSPDVPFRWTLNPYRGCEHGCVYCYARPDHEYLGFSCGIDFETRIIAKPEAPRLLAADPATVVMFAEHPHPELTPLGAAARAREVATSRGWIGRQVRFEEWRPYDRRFELPAISDLAVCQAFCK